jgi:glycosyltransferase involved in cell wall biosynthesis
LNPKRIFWVSFIFMDKDLYKTTQLEILRHLAKRGYEVFLFAAYSKKKYEKESSNLHSICIPLRDAPLIANAFFILSLLFFLPFYILYSKPDFLVVEPQDATCFSLMPLLLFPKAKRPKIILDVRTELVAESGGYRKHLKILSYNSSFYIAKKFFDGITTITPILKNEISEGFHIDPKSIGVWSSGVNLDHFNPEKFENDAKQLRKDLGLDNKFIVFYHGSFGADRGIIESVKSIELLKEQNNNVVLFLLGTGKLLASITKLIDEMDIRNKILLHEPVADSDVPKYIAMCNVGILVPSDLPQWKGQCFLKLLEYLAMRKSVIVSDIPAIRSVIGKNRCGIYVSGKMVDPKEIAEAIIYSINNKSQLEQWGLLSKKIVVEGYTWDKVAKDFEDYILTL